jgi:hypothetical protein
LLYARSGRHHRVVGPGAFQLDSEYARAGFCVIAVMGLSVVLIYFKIMAITDKDVRDSEEKADDAEQGAKEARADEAQTRADQAHEKADENKE